MVVVSPKARPFRSERACLPASDGIDCTVAALAGEAEGALFQAPSALGKPAAPIAF